MAYTTINKSTDYFNTKLYTGNASAGRSITGVGFKPDLVWNKIRSASGNHHWYDAVRGTQKFIRSNDATTEGTNGGTDGITAFGTDGYTIGGNTGVNTNNATFASWNWKAGTSVSGNTGGSGTYKSYTGSVNTTAGFSIIKYTGNGTAGHTIPHHLGVAPSMIITKIISGDTASWYVYHKSLGNTKLIVLNTTAAVSTSNAWWNATTPTSSVFTVGDQTGNNSNNNPIISYNFAEKTGYSKFGSYVGNGNANGTFVYTGFKPAFVIVKRDNGSENWTMHDNKRSTSNGFNPVDKTLHPNQNYSTSTGTARGMDLLSNGFKFTGTDEGNISSNTYIFMAFGQSIVGTNNVPCIAR